jgi:hypothetical protein
VRLAQQHVGPGGRLSSIHLCALSFTVHLSNSSHISHCYRIVQDLESQEARTCSRWRHKSSSRVSHAQRHTVSVEDTRKCSPMSKSERMLLTPFLKPTVNIREHILVILSVIRVQGALQLPLIYAGILLPIVSVCRFSAAKLQAVHSLQLAKTILSHILAHVTRLNAQS